MTTALHHTLALDTDAFVSTLRGMAIRSLHRMYLPDRRTFAFCLRKTPEGIVQEGVSRRYTATVLIGLATEPASSAAEALHSQSPAEVWNALADDLDAMEDLGEAALTLWAGRAIGHPDVDRAIRRVRQMSPQTGDYPNVEVCWALSGLSIQSPCPTDLDLADAIASRLLGSFHHDTGLFPHWPGGAKAPWGREHIACFADLVYPIQAMSHYHRSTGDAKAIQAAVRCAETMCRLQAPDGQWWWHYDVRTGQVVEGYPVYSVHQDSMAPMALHALRQACGRGFSQSIRLGLAWLDHAAEIDGSLLDRENDLIWRKVARKEPGKLSRKLHAAASRVHPSLRAPLIPSVFRPGQIDYETRPYHMGWILHAWPDTGA